MTYFCMNGAGNSFVVLDARGKLLLKKGVAI